MEVSPLSKRYVHHSAKIVHDEIDGEVLVIHSETGSYHSMRGLAGSIWAAASVGVRVDEVVEQVSAALPIDAAEVVPDVEAFVAALVEHDLVVEEGDGEIGRITVANGDYIAPVLESFTDMQDLILLDPIHEVDAAGWPHMPAE